MGKRLTGGGVLERCEITPLSADVAVLRLTTEEADEVSRLELGSFKLETSLSRLSSNSNEGPSATGDDGEYSSPRGGPRSAEGGGTTRS